MQTLIEWWNNDFCWFHLISGLKNDSFFFNESFNILFLFKPFFVFIYYFNYIVFFFILFVSILFHCFFFFIYFMFLWVFLFVFWQLIPNLISIFFLHVFFLIFFDDFFFTSNYKIFLKIYQLFVPLIFLSSSNCPSNILAFLWPKRQANIYFEKKNLNFTFTCLFDKYNLVFRKTVDALHRMPECMHFWPQHNRKQ